MEIFNAGGSLVAFAQRFYGAIENNPKLAEAVPKGPEYYLRRFYYDVAQAYHPVTLRALKTLVPMSQILFGTDFAFRTALQTIEGIEKSGVFNAQELRARGVHRVDAMAEAHHIVVAPHSGSLGPIAEFAALHVLAAIPNTLILERLEDDWAGRYEVTDPVPRTVDGYLPVPDRPGLGVDIVEDAVARYPSKKNVAVSGSPDTGAYEMGTFDEQVYFQTRFHRRKAFARSSRRSR